MGRRNPIRIGLPDFVAAGTGSAAGVLIIEAGARQDQYRDDKDGQSKGDSPVERFVIGCHHLSAAAKRPVWQAAEKGQPSCRAQRSICFSSLKTNKMQIPRGSG